MSGVSWLTLGSRCRRRDRRSASRWRTTTSRGRAPTCRCSCPKGGVLTKARDTIESFGYSDPGPRTSVSFIDAVDVEDITAMAGLPAAREAIRDGTPIAYWRAGITHTAEPSGGLEPAAGDYSVRLDPKGQLVAFATGYATDGNDRARRPRQGDRRSASRRSRKPYGLDASGYELEVVERSFPAGKTEMTWRSPATKYGHVEQLRVNLQGERLIMIERSLSTPRDYKAPATPMAMRIFNGAGLGGPRRRVRDRLGVRALLPVQDEELGRADAAGCRSRCARWWCCRSGSARSATPASSRACSASSRCPSC